MKKFIMTEMDKKHVNDGKTVLKGVKDNLNYGLLIIYNK